MNATHRKNIEILENESIYLSSTGIWKDKPDSVELETYTDAGENMIIDLEEPTRACLQGYINGFDIDDTIIIWWRNGVDAARAAGVPFDNISDHIADYKDYLKELQRVCNLLN